MWLKILQWLPLVVSLVLGAAWTYIIYGLHVAKKASGPSPFWKRMEMLFGKGSELSQWTNTLLSILLSVLLAASLGFLMFWAQEKKTDMDQTREFIRLINIELRSNLTSLDSAVPHRVYYPSGDSIDIRIAPVNFLVVGEAVRNELFKSSDREHMHRLILDAQEYNHLYSHTLNCIAQGTGNPGLDASLSPFAKKLNTLNQAIRKDIDTLAAHLKSAVED